ncbi:Tyrosyl-DNA phosphodiesterase 2 [Cytospora mali]|uniref:Tyrosyl-DNA phosphodiesterase 2 n=1 Tax=Cytospora mali TaxID=578113 RepID=A0A194VIG4_CYTMA|nr:Tyrosyl-DNA phosphodiesterase 2 [Valsa mali]
MDAMIAHAIKDTTVLRKSSVPWSPDEPSFQSYYAYDTTTHAWASKLLSTDVARNINSSEITNIALYTWNIDFLLPFAEARMKAALAYLDRLTNPESLPPTTAAVIFLQECTPSDLTTIAATPWVQARYHLTDVDPTNWATTHYGTTMLVDSRVLITAAFRVHYSKTRMDRDALFVDISLGPDSKTIRLCNTHLESLAFDPPFRPHQMQLIARYMHEEHVHAALAAGDFNAIQLFDRTLHEDGNNNLKDAFLELGGKEDTDEGFTWGQQAATKLREQFGCSRMDKVYFCGGVKLVRLERFGEDVLTEGEDESKQIVELGFEKPWVTDHLGVMAEVEIVPRLL